MSSSKFQSERIRSLLLDLLCLLDQGHGEKGLARAVERYAAALDGHHYMTVSEQAISRSFQGICEKFAISGRTKESVLLRLAKNNFFKRYTDARQRCIAADLRMGGEDSIPHSMLQLLLQLSDSPTAHGKSIPYFDLENLIATATNASNDSGETAGDEATGLLGDVLDYEAWRAQCAAEDCASDSEEENSWLEHEMRPISPKEDIADDGEADIEPTADQADTGEQERKKNFEYLQYGGHISQCTIRYSWEVPNYCSMSGPDYCTGLKRLDADCDNVLLLETSSVCRMLLCMLGGFQSDLFSFDSGASSGAVRFWIKSTTATRVATEGAGLLSTQRVLDWFVGLANVIQFCRDICSAAIQLASMPVTEKRNSRFGDVPSHIFIDNGGAITLEASEGAAVVNSATIGLFSCVQNQLDRLNEAIYTIEQKLFDGRGSSIPSVSVFSLHLAMLPWRGLFESMSAVVRSTMSTYLACVKSVSKAGNKSKYHKGLESISDHSIDEQIDAKLERGILAALTHQLTVEVNHIWFSSVQRNSSADLIADEVASSRGLKLRSDYDSSSWLEEEGFSSSDDEKLKLFDEDSLRLQLPGMACEVLRNQTPRVEYMCYSFFVDLLRSLLQTQLHLMARLHAQRRGGDTGIFVFDEHVEKLWRLASQSNKEFEIASRFPGVLSDHAPQSRSSVGEDAVGGMFRSISAIVCNRVWAQLSDVVPGSSHSINETAKMKRRNSSKTPVLPTAPYERHELFRNQLSEFFEVLNLGSVGAVISSSNESRREVSSGKGEKSSSVCNFPGIFNVLTCLSFLQRAAVGPVQSAIQETCSRAAASLVRHPVLSAPPGGNYGAQKTEGFQLFEHLEYIRRLFLMGGESYRSCAPFDSNGISVEAERSSSSPGTILINLQHGYNSIMGRLVLQRHESIDVLDSRGFGLKNKIEIRSDEILMGLSPELYALGESMLAQLIQSLPAATAGTWQQQSLSDGSIGISVSFRSNSLSDADKQPNRPINDEKAAAELPRSLWPSAAVAQMLCNHLAIELFYPFPLNTIFPPSLIHRLHNILRKLLNINMMRWAIEETWKLDKISKADLEDVLAGYKNSDEVQHLRQSVDRSRVSLSGLMHLVKGLLYYLMSDIHDNSWSELLDDIKEASRISVGRQAQSVSEFVQHVEGLMSLFDIYIVQIVDKGHAAVSAYQLALHAIADVCSCKSGSSNHGKDMLDSSRTHMIIGKCAAAVKRADIEFAAVRSVAVSFLGVLDNLGNLGGSEESTTPKSKFWNSGMAGVVDAASRMILFDNSVSEWGNPYREIARLISINESNRLRALLGNTWKTSLN